MKKDKKCQSVSNTQCDATFTPNCRQENKRECGSVTETKNEKVCDGSNEPKCSTVSVKECVVKNEQQCQSVNDR